MVIDLKQHKREKFANELAYQSSLLSNEDDLKTFVMKLANCMTEAEEIKYLCTEQNKKASKSRI